MSDRNLPPANQPHLRPNRWAGQAGCRVGPFSNRHVAESFANALVDFGRYETLSERVVTESGGVYVEVTRHRP